MNEQNIEPENGAACFPLETIVMSDGVDLMDFCAAHDERLEEPFTIGSHTFFSDGHCVVRVPVIESVDREAPFDSIAKIKFEAPGGGKWCSLPTIKIEMKECGVCLGTGKTTFCDECGGEGEVSFDTDNNTYEMECKECFGDGVTAGGHDTCKICNGSGERPKECWQVTLINGNPFSMELLNLIQRLPDVELYSQPIKDRMYPFRFRGGDGVLMGMLE